MDSAKVLIVDDEVAVLDGYRRGLRRQFSLDTASSGQDAIELIKRNPAYAVIVSDMRMPNMSGLELLTQVRDLSPDTVRIMLTGNSDQQTVVDALNHGAVYKFLNKPCDSATMGLAIASGLQHYHQIKANKLLLEKSASKVKGLRQKLSYQALHDPLTGLDNRRSFEIRLDRALESAQNNKLVHAVCHLNLDHFHVINNSYGIAAGDKLLQELPNILKLGRRRDDMVARLAGNEFGILLSDCNMQEARTIVQKLHQDILDFQLKYDDKVIQHLSASTGLTPITSEDKTVAAIIRTAEAACNLAREKGRGTVHVADPNDEELNKRLGEVLLTEDIIQALEENRFRLYHQTIFPLDPDNTDGQHYEILLRMLDQKGSIIMPNDFLPAAEHYHLTPKIDCWVIRNTVDWLSKHPEQLEKLSVCSINLSGLSLGSSEILDCITSAFASSSVPPEKICFEITETAAILGLEPAMEFIIALKARGFKFSLDDFGSGYSSFAYLKDLPVDFLKIDGMFVKNMDTDIVNRNMVKTMHEIGRTMGMKTIAEFVENNDIYKLLEHIEVDYAQGYLIAKPCPLDDLK